MKFSDFMQRPSGIVRSYLGVISGSKRNYGLKELRDIGITRHSDVKTANPVYLIDTDHDSDFYNSDYVADCIKPGPGNNGHKFEVPLYVRDSVEMIIGDVFAKGKKLEDCFVVAQGVYKMAYKKAVGDLSNEVVVKCGVLDKFREKARVGVEVGGPIVGAFLGYGLFSYGGDFVGDSIESLSDYVFGGDFLISPLTGGLRFFSGVGGFILGFAAGRNVGSKVSESLKGFVESWIGFFGAGG